MRKGGCWRRRENNTNRGSGREKRRLFCINITESNFVYIIRKEREQFKKTWKIRTRCRIKGVGGGGEDDATATTTGYQRIIFTETRPWRGRVWDRGRSAFFYRKTWKRKGVEGKENIQVKRIKLSPVFPPLNWTASDRVDGMRGVGLGGRVVICLKQASQLHPSFHPPPTPPSSQRSSETRNTHKIFTPPIRGSRSRILSSFEDEWRDEK